MKYSVFGCEVGKTMKEHGGLLEEYLTLNQDVLILNRAGVFCCVLEQETFTRQITG